MRKEDVIGIGTLVFTPKAEAFYLSSSSELARASMAAAHFLQPGGTLKIADGARHDMVLEEKKATTSGAKAADKDKEDAKKDSKAKAIIAEAAVAKQNQLNEQQIAGKNFIL